VTEPESSPAMAAALEEVTTAAFNGVLRALEARKLPLERFPGPIVVGIIAWPELRQGEARIEFRGERPPPDRG
jgi:hypothetical protein